MRASMTLTTPPIAEEPNSSARGPAQHLDPVGGQRIDRDRMVDAGAGHVEAADAVGQHPDAIALKAAQHGPRRARAEGGRRNARLVRSVSPIVGLRSRVSSSPLTTEVPERIVAVAREAGDDDLLLSGAWSRASVRAGAAAAGRGRAGRRGRLGESAKGGQGEKLAGQQGRSKALPAVSGPKL